MFPTASPATSLQLFGCSTSRAAQKNFDHISGPVIYCKDQKAEQNVDEKCLYCKYCYAVIIIWPQIWAGRYVLLIFYSNFWKLILLTFLCRAVQTNGVEAVKCNHRSHWCKYHADWLELAKLYTYTSAIICNVCSFSKTLLNKCNAHKLLEL